MQVVNVRGQTAAATMPVLGEQRSWQREVGGAFPAALRGLEGGKVILQSADGRTAMLELSTLSRNDRDYVRGKMAALVQRWLGQNSTPTKPAADRSGWPEVVSVPQESLVMSVKRPFEAGKGMKFASTHFEYDAPVEISTAEQRSIATPFELIHEVWRLAPWGVITRPKMGGLFQVELFLHAAAYEAAGAPPNSGCHFDRQSRKIRVLGSAMGLDAVRTPMWRDEQSPLPALVYSVNLALIQNLQHTLPRWLGPGLALGMQDLPVSGEVAWPRELLAGLGGTTVGITLTEAETRLYLHPADKTINPPFERDKLRRMASYLMQGDGSNGRNLAEFLAAVHADQPAWAAYFDHLDEWSVATKKAKSDPAVVVPALAPEPFGIKDPADLPWYHVAKLLGTTDLESGVRKAITTLKAAP